MLKPEFPIKDQKDRTQIKHDSKIINPKSQKTGRDDKDPEPKSNKKCPLPDPVSGKTDPRRKP